jgi:hypothetical protein
MTKSLGNNIYNMNRLRALTLLYISVPTFLFLAIWLKPLYAFLSILFLIGAFVLTGKLLDDKDNRLGNVGLNGVILSSFLIALVICLFSEFGMLPFESYDYLAHNFKFHILATEQLPLFDVDRQLYMCYYLGDYLVPAILGKYTSISLIKHYFFVWSWISVGLSFTWLQIRFIDLPHFKRVLLCIGLLIGCYVCVILPSLEHLLPQLTFIAKNGIDINTKFVLNQVPAFTRSFSESPQHTLPAILGACFLLATFDRPSYFFSLAYFLLGTLFLTPFAAIGMIGYMVVAFIRHWMNEGQGFFIKMVIFAVPLLIAFAPVILYLTSTEAMDMESNRMIWQSGDPYWWAYHLLFLGSAYGVWFLFFGKQLLRFDRTVIIVTCCILAGMSLFQFGHYNDLNIRSAIFPQMILGTGISFVVISNLKLLFRKFLFTVGVFFWLANGVGPVKFYYDRLFIYKGKRTSIENPRLPEYGKSYYDLMETAYLAASEEAVKQYSLRKGSFFENHLLKKR